MMGRILAIANQKGGVGKTTTAINLATALAIAERRILLVDMDPQGNLTSGVGLKGQATPAGTVYEAITAPEPIADLLVFALETRVKDMWLIPADRNLTGAEVELVALPHRESRLRALLEPLRGRFDFILIDTPPSLGLLTLNALVATLRRVRSALNPSLDIAGVLMTMYDERTNLGQQVARDIRDFFKDRVYDTVIPRNVR